MEATVGAAQKFLDDTVMPVYGSWHNSGELTLTAVAGRKYIKLVESNYGQRSVYGFVDADGNIYKAAGWQAPAKHTRGNIFSDTRGAEALDSRGFIRYLV